MRPKVANEAKTRIEGQLDTEQIRMSLVGAPEPCLQDCRLYWTWQWHS